MEILLAAVRVCDNLLKNCKFIQKINKFRGKFYTNTKKSALFSKESIIFIHNFEITMNFSPEYAQHPQRTGCGDYIIVQ